MWKYDRGFPLKSVHVDLYMGVAILQIFQNPGSAIFRKLESAIFQMSKSVIFQKPGSSIFRKPKSVIFQKPLHCRVYFKISLKKLVGKTNVKNIAPHPAQKGIDKKSQVKSLEESH